MKAIQCSGLHCTVTEPSFHSLHRTLQVQAFTSRLNNSYTYESMVATLIVVFAAILLKVNGQSSRIEEVPSYEHSFISALLLGCNIAVLLVFFHVLFMGESGTTATSQRRALQLGDHAEYLEVIGSLQRPRYARLFGWFLQKPPPLHQWSTTLPQASRLCRPDHGWSTVLTHQPLIYKPSYACTTPVPSYTAPSSIHS